MENAKTQERHEDIPHGISLDDVAVVSLSLGQVPNTRDNAPMLWCHQCSMMIDDIRVSR